MLKLNENDIKAVARYRYNTENIWGVAKVYIALGIMAAGIILIQELDNDALWCFLLPAPGAIGALYFLHRYISKMHEYIDEAAREARKCGCQAVIDGVPVQPVKGSMPWKVRAKNKR